MHNLTWRKIKIPFLSFLTISATIFFLFFTTINTSLKKTTLNYSSKPLLSKSDFHIHRRHLQIAQSTCEDTLYPELCVSTLSSFPDLSSKSISEIIASTANHTVSIVQTSASNCTGIKTKLKKYLDPHQKQALDDCLELFDDTIADLRDAISDLHTQTLHNSTKYYHNLQTLFSAAMTNQYTCLDGFAYSNGNVRKQIEKSLYKISHLVSNSLAMLKKLHKKKKSIKHQNEEDNSVDNDQVFPEYGKMANGLPGWMSRENRRLLQSPVNQIKINLVVAKDGSGNFATVSAAVNAAPSSITKGKFVIHIKAGAYLENVEIVRNKKNIMFIGDGIGKTVIKASRNVVDGSTTFRSATVAVVGDGFIARDITFENSAGPSKHQAVALRSGSDLSAFYRCSFVGYQDTLYVHSLRQFYKECDVYGTVDFIFGNAAVVFQNCNLYARKPDANQKNVFTAQGREDPNQNTGISILNCKLTAAADLIPLKSSIKTFLGRPWKQYSRIVVIGSLIDDVVDPKGYLEWDGNFALSTLYYGEYMNRGVGSNTANRVKWPGFRVISNAAEANRFTVAPFIQGSIWLPSTGVPFYPGLN